MRTERGLVICEVCRSNPEPVSISHGTPNTWQCIEAMNNVNLEILFHMLQK
jgi:hypothetical protein